jgi:hypothetical protein
MDEERFEKYINNPKFHEFVDREFDLVAAGAPIEDLADFAFGGIEEAVEAFEKLQKELIIAQFDREDPPFR